MSEKEPIVAAAILVKPRKENDLPVVMSVPRPGRHPHIVHTMARAGLPTPIGGEEHGYVQGFLTTDGDFVDREEAESIARAAGQVTKPNIGGALTSEDLW